MCCSRGRWRSTRCPRTSHRATSASSRSSRRCRPTQASRTSSSSTCSSASRSSPPTATRLDGSSPMRVVVLLCPPGDIEAFADALLGLTDPAIRRELGQNGRQAVLDRYNWASASGRADCDVYESMPRPLEHRPLCDGSRRETDLVERTTTASPSSEPAPGDRTMSACGIASGCFERSLMSIPSVLPLHMRDMPDVAVYQDWHEVIDTPRHPRSGCRDAGGHARRDRDAMHRGGQGRARRKAARHRSGRRREARRPRRGIRCHPHRSDMSWSITRLSLRCAG